jgi:Kef-type K+ transport system membrane component KefB
MELHLLLPVILLSATLLSKAARSVRLPAVIGVILAGVILGPAVLGILPTKGDDPVGFGLVQSLAQIGLCVLLFQIGLETRLKDFIAVWRLASGTAVVGMVLPFVLGWGMASLWGVPQLGAMFIGATLTATSISVTASVLTELGAQHSKEGAIVLGAAILDDILGLILLSSLMAVVSPEVSAAGHILSSIAQAVLLISLGIFIGPYLVRAVLFCSGWKHEKGGLLVFTFSYLLLVAYAAEAIGLDMILGAYAAGVGIARHPQGLEVEKDLRPFIEILTPLFFILLGASIKFSGLSLFSEAGREAWLFTLGLLTVAVVGKLLCGFWVRQEKLNRVALGGAMMPRGEVGLVFAQIGLTTGTFSSEIFSSVIWVLIATTIIGPIVLRFSWKSAANGGVAD